MGVKCNEYKGILLVRALQISRNKGMKLGFHIYLSFPCCVAQTTIYLLIYYFLVN